MNVSNLLKSIVEGFQQTYIHMVLPGSCCTYGYLWVREPPEILRLTQWRKRQLLLVSEPQGGHS